MNQVPSLDKMELAFLEGISITLKVENAITLCYRPKNDYRIFIQKVIVDLNLNSASLTPYEILYSKINGMEMMASNFTFVSASLCITIYESNRLVLWEKDLMESSSSFFDSFKDSELGKWTVAKEYMFSSNVLVIRKRDLSVWVGLEDGNVFEIQVNPWNIQLRDSNNFPFLDFSLFLKQLNSDLGNFRL